MVEQHFCLRWNNYRTNITAEFETLREGEHFVDVTLACDGRQLKAHKVVLSACSPYFKELLQGNPCSHPIIILRDVAYSHMRSLLEFMYAGEVNISQAHLGSFLHTAEALKIRGLAESSDERKEQSRGGNSMSPLSALKTSLGNYGGISFGGLGPSVLDRPIIPQLLPHSGDSNHSLVGGSAPPFASPPDKSQGPLSLTVSDARPPKADDEAPLPLSLPPNKRMRPALLNPKESSSGEKNFDSQNGCSFGLPQSNACASPTDKISTNTPTDEIMETVPKIEPLDPPISDHEGSGGWPEDGDGMGMGRESPPDNTVPPDAESPSHLLQAALSSESHLPGILRNFEPLPCPVCQRSYSSPGNLKQHLENIHMSSKELIHQCRICGNKFKSKWYLHKHLHRAHHIRGRKEI